MLLNSLGSLAVRHAFLLGHEETTDEDWAAVARAAADSVPPWIQKAVKYLAEHPAVTEESAATARRSLLQ
jgi:hypothetical protein